VIVQHVAVDAHPDTGGALAPRRRHPRCSMVFIDQSSTRNGWSDESYSSSGSVWPRDIGLGGKARQQLHRGRKPHRGPPHMGVDQHPCRVRHRHELAHRREPAGDRRGPVGRRPPRGTRAIGQVPSAPHSPLPHGDQAPSHPRSSEARRSRSRSSGGMGSSSQCRPDLIASPAPGDAQPTRCRRGSRPPSAVTSSPTAFTDRPQGREVLVDPEPDLHLHRRESCALMPDAPPPRGPPPRSSRRCGRSQSRRAPASCGERPRAAGGAGSSSALAEQVPHRDVDCARPRPSARTVAAEVAQPVGGLVMRAPRPRRASRPTYMSSRSTSSTVAFAIPGGCRPWHSASPQPLRPSSSSTTSTSTVLRRVTEPRLREVEGFPRAATTGRSCGPLR
jgi:hypothetical protein